MYCVQKNQGKQQKQSKQLSQIPNKCGIGQDCFDQMVIKYIINGIQPLRSVEDASFKELVLGNWFKFAEY